MESTPNIVPLPGKRFGREELKLRLHLMGVQYDSTRIDRNYYIKLYDYNIQNDIMKNRIYNKLCEDMDIELPNKVSLKRQSGVSERVMQQPFVDKKVKLNNEMEEQQYFNVHQTQQNNETGYEFKQPYVNSEQSSNYVTNNKQSYHSKQRYSMHNNENDVSDFMINKPNNVNCGMDYSNNNYMNNNNNYNQFNQQQQQLYHYAPETKLKDITESANSRYSNISNRHNINSHSNTNTHITNRSNSNYRQAVPSFNKEPSSFRRQSQIDNTALSIPNDTNIPTQQHISNNTTSSYIETKPHNEAEGSSFDCFDILKAIFVICGISFLFYLIMKNRETLIHMPSNIHQHLPEVHFSSIITWPMQQIKRLIYKIIKEKIKQTMNYLLWVIGPLSILKIIHYYIKKSFERKRIIREIFADIRETLKDLARRAENDPNITLFGLPESEITLSYSTRYGIKYDDFVKNYLPKLREMRKKDKNIKLYQDLYKGKEQTIWGWND